jgi:hypothetical protein
MTQQLKIAPEDLNMILDTISKLEKDRLSLETKLEMDRTGDFPLELIRFMLGPEMALHLVFVPEEYGGLGAGATEIAIVSERMAKMDLAVASSFLAICLGMDPIRVGATDRRGRPHCGLWRDRTRCGIECPGPQDQGGTGTGRGRKHQRLQDQRPETIHLQRRGGRPLHDPF